MDIGALLRLQSAKLLKAAEMAESETDPSLWLPVPRESLVISFEEWLGLLAANCKEDSAGAVSVQMAELSRALFGAQFDPDLWERLPLAACVEITGLD